MLPKNPTTADYLIDIIATELDLPNDRVNLYNQKFNIPDDKFLFVGVEFKYSVPFSAKSETYEGEDGSFNERQGLNTQEHYAIKLFSRNEDAFRRKEEVAMALASIYARQQGDKYGFKIARVARPIQDLTLLEGAANLYRFDINLVVFARYEKTKTVPWYGTFAGEVTIQNGENVVAEFSPEEH